MARHLKEMERTLNPRSIGTYLSRLRRFLAFCHEHHIRYVYELTAALVADYQRFLLELGLNPRTVDSEVRSTIGALVVKALQHELLRKNLRARLPRLLRVPAPVFSR